MDFWNKIFDRDFMPHGHCYFWKPEVLWPHVIGDGLTALAYFIIPILLWYFIKKRSDVKLSQIYIAFAAFILFCGATHSLAIVSVWDPIYRLEGVVKLMTAGVSLGTVFLLAGNMSTILKLPSPEQLTEKNKELLKEVERRRLAEQEVRDINEQLEQRVQERTEELKKVNEDLKVFSSMMSHDLKAPAQNMKTLIKIMKEENEDMPHEVSEGLDAMSKGVDSMLELINNMLYLSKYGGSLKGQQVIDVSEILKETINPFNQLDQVSVNYDLETILTAKCDRIMLKEAFQNLLSNAIKYSSKEAAPSVKVRGYKEGAKLKIEFIDNGIGIKPDDQERIFGRFVRGSESAEDFEGSGIGLSLVKRILEKHGGEINVKSEQGVGSTFTVVLPAAK